MWSIYRWRWHNCWFSCTSVLISAPSTFHLLDLASLRKANLEASAHHVRLEMRGHDTRARGHILRCPCLPPQGPGLISWSPRLPPHFFATFPFWPGYCSLLCFLSQHHEPWQCLQGVQDDVRRHQIYVNFFHTFVVLGSTMHPAWSLGILCSLRTGAIINIPELCASSPTLVIQEICSFWTNFFFTICTLCCMPDDKIKFATAKLLENSNLLERASTACGNTVASA